MKYRKLGHTDIDVSLICLGTMTYGEQNTEAEGHEQIDYAISQGINFLDTAELYPVPPMKETYSKTETIIGSWIKKNPQKRSDIILATKIVGAGSWTEYIRKDNSFNEKIIMTAIESSLSRLQTDYIDLYQLHWPERKTNFFGQLGFKYPQEEDCTSLEETLKALSKSVTEGKIRYIGLSNETPWGTMKFLALAEKMGLEKIVSVQNPYNLLNRVYEVGLAEISYRESVSLLAYSPLAFGVLTGKYLNQQHPKGSRLERFKRFDRYTSKVAMEITQKYWNIAQEHNLTLTELALAFVSQQEFVTSNIIGATKISQLKENINSVNITLDKETLKAIKLIHESNSNPCP